MEGGCGDGGCWDGGKLWEWLWGWSEIVGVDAARSEGVCGGACWDGGCRGGAMLREWRKPVGMKAVGMEGGCGDGCGQEGGCGIEVAGRKEAAGIKETCEHGGSGGGWRL